ncbi:MAG: OB-fold domain-containing protein [Novosphingobium sp.]
MTQKILPVDFDRDTGPFFTAARDHRLVYRHCRDCGRGIHIPSQTCKHCGSLETEWREASGRGQLFSWTVTRNPTHPAYPVPYTIVVVSLEEAPDVRLIGRIDGAAELEAGQPMQVWFDDVGEGVVLPQWRPA